MRFTIALTILASLLAVEAAPTPTPTKRCATNIECLKERALIAAARLEVRDPPAGDKVRRQQAASAALPPRPTSTTTLYTQTGKQAIRLAAGRYEIAAWGAQGGSALVSGGTQLAGGTGANINSTFVFNQANDVVLIIAGRGGNEPVGSTGANAGGAGGGGGSFVYTSTGTPILIAGGGGGSAFNRDVSPASTGTSGTQGRGGGGVGGTNGSGGGASNVNGQTLVSGGGAGFFSDGMPSSNAASGRSRPNFNGGVGSSARGGFGGGGGGGRSAGGGGGGYSGGGAGREGGSSSGGGGGSFSNSNFRVTTVPVAAVNTWAGSGQILIRGPL